MSERETPWPAGPYFISSESEEDEALITNAAREDAFQVEIAKVDLGFSGDVDKQNRAALALFLAAPEMAELVDGWLSESDGWDRAQLDRRYSEAQVARILKARAVRSRIHGESA